MLSLLSAKGILLVVLALAIIYSAFIFIRKSNFSIKWIVIAIVIIVLLAAVIYIISGVSARSSVSASHGATLKKH